MIQEASSKSDTKRHHYNNIFQNPTNNPLFMHYTYLQKKKKNDTRKSFLQIMSSWSDENCLPPLPEQ